MEVLAAGGVEGFVAGGEVDAGAGFPGFGIEQVGDVGAGGGD